MIPFMIYFLSCMFYFSNFLFDDFDDSMILDFSAEFFCRVILIILLVYFFLYELLQIQSNGLNYFLDIWNWVDISSFFLQVYLLVEHLFSLGWLDREYIVIVAFIAMIIMWSKVFFWLKLFSQTSFYIRLIGETIIGVAWFLLIFLITILMFANCMYILNANRTEDNQLFEKSFPTSFALSSIISLY